MLDVKIYLKGAEIFQRNKVSWGILHLKSSCLLKIWCAVHAAWCGLMF